MMQASSSNNNDSFHSQAYKGLTHTAAFADEEEEQLSASAKLERAYILSMGGILDREGMLRPPSLGAMDAEKGALLASGPPPQFPSDQQEQRQSPLDRYPSLTSEPADDFFFAGVFDDDDEPMLTPEAPSRGDSRVDNVGLGVPSSIEVQQNDVFTQSLQALEKPKGATSHELPLPSQVYWTVQEAMAKVEACNQARNAFQASSDILLTLTSFPFRIVHGTASLLTSSTLGAPLSTVLSSDYHQPPKSTQPIPQAPVILQQSLLFGRRQVNVQLIPVISNSATTQSSAALVYYAIALQDEGGSSRTSSLSSGI